MVQGNAARVAHIHKRIELACGAAGLLLGNTMAASAVRKIKKLMTAINNSGQ